jgi:hypothetical protein
MNFKEELEGLCIKFANRVECAILNGEFEILRHDKYCDYILVDDVTIEMWTANGVDNYRIYRIEILGHAFYFPKIKFQKAGKCAELTSKPALDEIEIIEQEIATKFALLKKLKGE